MQQFCIIAIAETKKINSVYSRCMQILFFSTPNHKKVKVIARPIWYICPNYNIHAQTRKYAYFVYFFPSFSLVVCIPAKILFQILSYYECNNFSVLFYFPKHLSEQEKVIPDFIFILYKSFNYGVFLSLHCFVLNRVYACVLVRVTGVEYIYEGESPR